MKKTKLSLRLLNLIVALMFLSVIVLAILGTITEEGHVDAIKVPVYSSLYKGCFFKNHYGVDCPTCGLTRSFYAFFDGEFAKAYEFNHVSFSAIFVFIMMIINSGYYVIKDNYHKVILGVLYGGIAVLVVTMIIRYYTVMQIITNL